MLQEVISMIDSLTKKEMIEDNRRWEKTIGDNERWEETLGDDDHQ